MRGMKERALLKTFLREIVYGGTDGIVTTFAVVAGYSGAQGGNLTGPAPLITVLLFGFANLVSDATSMGLGNFLSVQADQELYRSERSKLLDTASAQILPETLQELLTKEGYSQQDAKDISLVIAKNSEYAAELIVEDHLNIPNPLRENPFLTGFATFVAFLIFGIIPLFPYLVTGTYDKFLMSAGATCLSLLLLGLLRWKVTRRRPFKALFETLLLGGSAAILAYGVGRLFHT